MTTAGSKRPGQIAVVIDRLLYRLEVSEYR